MRFGKAGGMGAGAFADQEVDVALAVKRGGAVAVAGYGREAHAGEQGVQGFGIRVRELHELEAIGSGRVVFADGGAGCVVREWTHGCLLVASAARAAAIGSLRWDIRVRGAGFKLPCGEPGAGGARARSTNHDRGLHHAPKSPIRYIMPTRYGRG